MARRCRAAAEAEDIKQQRIDDKLPFKASVASIAPVAPPHRQFWQ
jgi:hypothetical protein